MRLQLLNVSVPNTGTGETLMMIPFDDNRISLLPVPRGVKHDSFTKIGVRSRTKSRK